MTVSDDDRRAFAAATSDVRPLKPDNKARLEPQRPPPKARQSRAARRALLEESLRGPEAHASWEEVGFRREQLGDREFRKLRRGDYAVEAEVDLHGMRIAEAREALKDFLNECVRSGISCVRVIHGKGTRSGPDGPVLKPSVHHWLSRWDRVLAYTSAQPRHGGSGAVYVLLRRGS